MTSQSGPTAGTHERMPVLFIPHGAGPCFFMDWNPADTWTRLAGFLKGVAGTLPARPNAIVLVSGHWLEPQFSVTGHARPPLIYDYSGFPPHTYELTYPAPGSPGLAAQVAQLLGQDSGAARVDATRGFDHGVFIPLKLMFPGADIPVIQLSLRRDLDPQAHIEAGRALASLRDEGVLIVGSGLSWHNLRMLGPPARVPSKAFDDWLQETLVSSKPEQRDARLLAWESAPSARVAHPEEDHLIPLMVAVGASDGDAATCVYHEEDAFGGVTASSFRFGSAPPH